jgi:threonine dehydrogenase-like Zn-dependent dehydrogenase
MRRRFPFKNCLIHNFIIFLNLAFVSSFAKAQSKKIDLEDVNIQGELHKQDQLQLLARERVMLKGMVELRTNYKDELSEELPEGFEKAFAPKKRVGKK